MKDSKTNVSKNVAVIGAGAAGLVACKELLSCGHIPVVFEQQDMIGGIWAYDPNIESDLVGSDDSRRKIHSSMYHSLRTNLPREVMSFLDFPFVNHPGSEDQDRYCGHEAVLCYLKHFAAAFNILPHIEFSTRVDEVKFASNNGSEPSWLLTTYTLGKSQRRINRNFDAVIVCNGHYSQPKIAPIPGIENWPGLQIHSHNYRQPDPFRGQVVILIGASASGVDIARELNKVASDVHICHRGWTKEDIAKEMAKSSAPLHLHQRVSQVYSDGGVEFEDGSRVIADVIMHCTGYSYYFPFLDGIKPPPVTVSEGRIHPLYKHIFPPKYAPSLSFVGIPWQVAPFPLMQVQSMWIARALSGTVSLPPAEEMFASVEAVYDKMRELGVAQRYTHSLGSQGLGGQFEYLDDILERCSLPPVEKWRRDVYIEAGRIRRLYPDNYRDSWEDMDDLREAVECQAKIVTENIQWFSFLEPGQSPWPRYAQAHAPSILP